jgi:Ran GTPase-activating protein (RanGAP) involved in mRNA processing and transport
MNIRNLGTGKSRIPCRKAVQARSRSDELPYGEIFETFEKDDENDDDEEGDDEEGDDEKGDDEKGEKEGDAKRGVVNV